MSSVDSNGDWRQCVEWETSNLKLGEWNFALLQMAELPPTASLFMLAEMHENETEISGKRLWAGSHLLASFLIKHRDMIVGKTVLELGAGTGICSMVAEKLNGKEIVATDGDMEVVEILEKNIKENKSNVKTTS